MARVWLGEGGWLSAVLLLVERIKER
uniref:Uncharacterized protein n=1 Tax=Arundo donax TaxID=35708 RepID=A0A0A9CAH4_ARUDO